MSSQSNFCSLFFFPESILIISSGTEEILGAKYSFISADCSDEELGVTVLTAISEHEDFSGEEEAEPPFFKDLNFESWHEFDAQVLFECEVEIGPDEAIVRPFGPAAVDADGGREPVPGAELPGPASPDCIGMNVRIAFFTTSGKRI